MIRKERRTLSVPDAKKTYTSSTFRWTNARPYGGTVVIKCLYNATFRAPLKVLQLFCHRAETDQTYVAVQATDQEFYARQCELDTVRFYSSVQKACGSIEEWLPGDRRDVVFTEVTISISPDRFFCFLFPGKHHRRLFSLAYPLIKAPYLRVVVNRNRSALHRKPSSELKIPILNDVARCV